MRRNKSPYQVMMEELAVDSSLWDLETHIAGCFAGYQQNQEFGTAVYFALEMLWGIAVQGRHLEKDGITEYLSASDATLSSPLKKASLTGFHATAKHIAAKAVSPSSETMRTI